LKIICNHFGDPVFSRLARALRLSVEANAPDVEVFDEVITDPPKHVDGLLPHYTDNHEKLKVWRSAIHAEPDGTEVVLMDADTIVLGPLAEAFDTKYDIGWTWRPGRLPVNSGVVFVTCNDRSRAFMDAWVDRDQQLMDHRTLADHGKRKFGGANQASFMWLITHGKGQDIADCHDLMCRHWNSVDQTWCQFDDDTKILHIKGRLRDACVGSEPTAFMKALKLCSVNGVESDIEMSKLADIWRQYDESEVAV
jgi:hypothetical protein